jgi:hypothetical protein
MTERDMDFEKALLLLQALDDQKVDYILVGALGMTVHGIIRATQDIDLFVRPLEDNIASLRKALNSLFPADGSISKITAEDLAGEYPAIQYNSPDGSLQIDILSKLGDAFSFEDLQFEEKYYEGVRVLVATPETLYRMKKNTVRLQDRADAETIKEIFNLQE